MTLEQREAIKARLKSALSKLQEARENISILTEETDDTYAVEAFLATEMQIQSPIVSITDLLDLISDIEAEEKEEKK